MKSWVIFLSILAVGIFAFDSASWAMGRKGKGERSRFSNSAGSATLNQDPEAEHQQSTFNLEPLVQEDKPEEPTTVTPTPSAATSGQEGTQAVSVEEEFPSNATVPEPATLTLMGLGMAGLLYSRRKKSA